MTAFSFSTAVGAPVASLTVRASRPAARPPHARATARRTTRAQLAANVEAPGTAPPAEDPSDEVPALAAKPTLLSKPPMPTTVRPTPAFVEPAEETAEEGGVTAAVEADPVDGGAGEKGGAGDEAEQEVVTYTRCGKCSAAYRVTQAKLGPRGSKVRCSVCGHLWFQHPSKLSKLGEGEEFDDMSEEDIAAAKRGELRTGAARREKRMDGRSKFTIFVGNLPYTVEQEQVHDMFSSVTEVVSVRLATAPDGRSKGFAFVDVKSKEELDKCIEDLNGLDLGGRPISVREGKSSGTR
mmetsp:Transcript_45327/g.111179  ORF Transcript_45327/g.111179 Transcript_45327/m.111179 type:complete len:295 (-) Transcript_45327:158-1042(-)